MTDLGCATIAFVRKKKDSSSTLESALLSNTRYSHGHAHASNKIMLTVPVQDFNTFTQEFYNSVISSLQLHRLECSCGHSGCLSVHGYYTRSVITPAGKITLTICRVKCSECGHTHALLLSSMVPYALIPAKVQQEIVTAYEDGSDRNRFCSSGGGIDENNVKSVIRRYVRSWRERLRAAGIGLESLAELIAVCFSHYSRQFMQIRSTFNNLIASPT